jgi:drug/metabolite transporter (DMT)-like permease
MAWFPVALAAFFLFAVAVVVDKLMLTRTAIVPLAYAFSICLMSAAASLVFFFIPILIAEGRLLLPRGFPLAAATACGVSQFLGLLCMFEAVRRGEVSKASPMIVSLQPVASLLLTLVLPPLVHLLAPHQVLGLHMVAARRLVGVGMIIAGGYLLSQAGEKKTAFGPGTWLYVVLAGCLLAAANVFADISYTVFERAYLTPQAGAGERQLMFAKAFVWTRWMSLAAALVYVAFTGSFSRLRRRAGGAGQPGRRAAAGGRPEGGQRIRRHWAVLLFLLGQGCGALAVVLQQFAIKLGNVVAVTALGGVQFFFVIALSSVLSRAFPQLLSEGSSRGALLQKALWSALLFGGVVLLAV